jgi:hypothetical protein
VPFTQVIAAAQNGDIALITVTGSRVEAKSRADETTLESRVGKGTDVLAVLQDAGVSLGAGEGAVTVEYKTSTYGLWVGWSFAVRHPSRGRHYVFRRAVRDAKGATRGAGFMTVYRVAVSDRGYARALAGR